jgi:hypothetical protein
MLDTLPYADLLAIYNALAEKSVARFDTRANGVRRTAALMEERGMMLPDAAQLAGVVLPDGDAVRETPPPGDPGDMSDETRLPWEYAGTTNDELRSASPDQEAVVQIQVDPGVATLVSRFAGELMKPVRPRYLATFLCRLNSDGARNPREKPGRQMTASQRKIVDLCRRPEGATGKELAEGCGWPSIAARASCEKIADRFGYMLHETPRTKERGICFHLTLKPATEA